MSEKDDSQKVKAKALGDMVITEHCPQCGQIHKWIWPNHPQTGEKDTKNCCGKRIEVKIVPESEYEEPEDNIEEKVIDELVEKAKNGDQEAKKALGSLSRDIETK